MDPLVILEVVAGLAVVLFAVEFATGGEWRTDRRTRGQTPAEDHRDSVLEHALVLVAWAEGSRQDWDRHVRPVLAREFEDRVGTRRSGAESVRQTGEFLFGPDLWPLVDPAARFTERLGADGPGRTSLERILDRLEAA